MHGLLSDRPLAEIIYELTDARSSGALRLTRERVRAVIYFEQGQVVAALSNLRSHRLAEFARRTGAIAAGTLESITGEGLPDDAIADELVRSGTLSAAELGQLLSAQSADVLRLLLRWDEGEWEYDPRVRLAGAHRARPETGRLLVEHVRELGDEKISSALGEDEALAPSESVTDNETLARLGLGPTEAFVLSRVTGQTTFGELLLVGGLPEAETRRAAYALTLCGLLRRVNAVRAFTPEAVRQTLSRNAPAHAARDAGERTTATQTAEEEKNAHGGTQSSPPVEEAEKPARGDAVEDVREAMEELLALSRKTTHYDVLGVVRTASPAEIKRAYHGLARRLHPDRFRRDAGGEFVRQLDISFARVTQAYEVLKDSAQRATYDLKLVSKTAPAPTAPPPQSRPSATSSETARANPSKPSAAEKGRATDASAKPNDAEGRFQQGLEALKRGDRTSARQFFGEAALLSPRSARYRAYYGRALAQDRTMRRQAEAELQAALALDEKNASYRVMLAELYVELGLRRRAEGELRRALSDSPGHAEARRLLERLGGESQQP